MKHKPLRMCVACRGMHEKEELYCFVKQSDGSVVVDETYKLNGRSAYICRSRECLERAKKTRGLERSLKCQIPEECFHLSP